MEEFLRHGFTPFIDPRVYAMLMSPNKGEQLSMAVTASVIWLYAYVRYWSGHGLVYLLNHSYDYITRMITDRIGRHELLIANNHNLNKICDI